MQSSDDASDGPNNGDHDFGTKLTTCPTQASFARATRSLAPLLVQVVYQPTTQVNKDNNRAREMSSEKFYSAILCSPAVELDLRNSRSIAILGGVFKDEEESWLEIN